MPNPGMLDPGPGFCAGSVASPEPLFDGKEDGFAGPIVPFVVARFVSFLTVSEASPPAVFDAMGDGVIIAANIFLGEVF